MWLASSPGNQVSHWGQMLINIIGDVCDDVCDVLYYINLHCIALRYIVLHYIASHRITPHHIIYIYIYIYNIDHSSGRNHEKGQTFVTNEDGKLHENWDILDSIPRVSTDNLWSHHWYQDEIKGMSSIWGHYTHWEYGTALQRQRDRSE